MPNLFISYRRNDNADATGRLADILTTHFGKENVFIDVDTIPYGVDFRKHLGDAVSKCDVLMAIIGDQWLDASYDEGPRQGKRRLDDPQDWVRIEIETALARGIPVVPVLVGQASMPGEAALPEGLKELAFRNAATVRSGSDYRDNADRLVRGLERLFAKKGEVKEGVQKATALAGDDPEMALVRCHKVLEQAIRDVYQRRINEPPGNRSLEKLTQRLCENGDFPDYLDVATVVRKLGGVGTLKMSGPELNRLFADVMEVVNWYLAVEQADAVGELSNHKATHRPITPPAAQLESKIAVVPKGLRSYDANDADFFLDLLPGPRDKDGLPESIRFWKHCIEEKDELTFTVGAIYGPSGCGKSSLVKAGLLPRLAENVLAVYVEAASETTEARLLHRLRKRCTQLPPDLDLTRTIAALRQGKGMSQGHKVIIVLDQFEQWLHVKGGEQNTELAQALRQCDGEQIQCIVIVRDDFWMALSRFMNELHIGLVQGQNLAPVDLFDGTHARNVLSAFGRAFRRLNEPPTKQQDLFLDQAVKGLAQNGRVISVRLALFAEMMRGKPWTPATLKEIGGMEGVGVTFLEETFSATTAPPEHRYHQKAARAVLKALLPEAGTDIKGHMRSQEDLLEASGYASRPKDFADLLRILDSAIRLMTPTDPEGKEADGYSVLQMKPGQKYYQLTHDYLVHSIREWLTRKQKETRRGRAELLLEDRAAVWNARKENRQLPSLLQWFQIKWLTARKHWTPPQRKMMANASRYHAVRGLIVAVLLVTGTLMGLGIGSYVIEQNNATHAAGLVNTLLNAKTAQVPEIITKIDEYRTWADPLLREENAKTPVDSQQKLHASLALLSVDPGQVDYLYRRLLAAEPNEVAVIGDALAPHKDALRDKLWAVVEAPEKGKESHRLRAASALAKYDPENEKWANSSPLVVHDLVLENAVSLGQWSESFWPVRKSFLKPLSDIFHDRNSERASERTLATNLLADYAAEDPQMLADLLMDADGKQFARIYPLVAKRCADCLAQLAGEIDKQAVVVADKVVFDKEGEIKEDDAKIKVTTGKALPAKRFEVRLQGGKMYKLTMDSKELDSFLVLQDKTGKELGFDDDSGGDLNSLLVYTASIDDTYMVFAASFKGTGSFQLRIVETFTGDDGKEKLANRQANAAVALLKMNQPEKVWPLLKHSPDPRVRSYLLHQLGPLGADAGVIIQRLANEPDITIRRALILSLGEFGEEKLAPAERKALIEKLQDIYRKDGDPGLHAAAEWLLRTWKQAAWLQQVNQEWAKDKKERDKRLEGIEQTLAKEKEKRPPQWYVNGQGHTMVVIPGPVEFMMGSPPAEVGHLDIELLHKKRIGRTFAIAAKSVTMAQILAMRRNYFGKDEAYVRRHAPTDDCPALAIGWHGAAEYCNWLSEKEGIDEKQWCYEMKKGQVTALRENYLSLTGYRLPTEAEMEYATRAGAVTSRYFGETEDLLPKYAWYQKNSQEKAWPVGSLKPNDFGLFEAHGNVFTWCQETYKAYPSTIGEEAIEDKEDGLKIINTSSRVLRGGSFINRASNVRSAIRTNDVPRGRLPNFGFRLARTLPLVPLTALPPTPEWSGK